MVVVVVVVVIVMKDKSSSDDVTACLSYFIEASRIKRTLCCLQEKRPLFFTANTSLVVFLFPNKKGVKGGNYADVCPK